MIVLSFDPGTGGAGAIIGLPGGPQVFDLPSVEIPGGEGKTRRRLHAPALYQLLMSRLAGAQGVHAICEGLATGGFGKGRGSNASSNGSQYRTRGVLEATLELIGLDLCEVAPATWKKLYGIPGKGATSATQKAAKEASRATAVKLYPDLAGDLKRVGDTDRAEALLIAHWFRRELLRKNEAAARPDPFA